jgi:molybdopterin synthase sulfur carrier subunit
VSDEDQVTVRFFAGARAAAGCDQVLVGPAGLQEVIQALHASFPALKNVTPVCSFLVDGISARARGDGPFISGGSSLDVLPPFAGG